MSPTEGAAGARPAVRVRLPIFVKLALVACVLALVPLAVVGYRLIEVNRREVENLNNASLIFALRDVTHTIDAELGQSEDDLGEVAALFANPALSDDTRLSTIEARLEGRVAMDHVALYDRDGTRLAVMEEEVVAGVTVPETLSAELREVAGRLNVASGEVTGSEAGARLLMIVPIRVDGTVTGFVASATLLQAIEARVVEVNATLLGDDAPGLPPSVFVVDSSMHLVADPNARAVLDREERHDGILAGVTPEMIGPTLSFSSEYALPDGTPMLGTVAAVPGRPWAVVVQIPQSIAYASIAEMQQNVAITVAIAMLVALVVGLLLARSISRPVAALTAYSEKLAQRQWGERVDVKTRDELAVLGGALNHAASELAASEAQIRHEVAVRQDLGRYVPQQLVDRIVRREADMKLGGERRAITVLFADVVGFTPMAERLPPEATVAILNELFTILTQLVFKHDGTVDKFIGDCVMAFWNAPGDQADHVRRALECAEDMQSWLETGNERWRAKYGVAIELAIGIHTGEAIVGNIGSEKRMEYTAIGNVVNLAARLEAVARPSQILVTDAVKLAAGDDYPMLDADLHRLTGWAEPVHLWEFRP